MIKCYVKIDGMWVRVFETHGWYDVVCWMLAATIGITVLFLLYRNF